MWRLVSAALALFGALLSPALAQQQPQRSECLAMANAAPRVMSVAFRQATGASYSNGLRASMARSTVSRKLLQ